MIALERRLGSAGAARLVDEFYKVARDVAFKHDALVDLPRPPGDARDAAAGEPAAAYAGHGPHASTTGAGHDTVLRVVVGLPVPSEDDAGRAIRLALALVDALDGIGSDVEPELRLALAVQRGAALIRRAQPPRRGDGGALSEPVYEPAYEIDEATAAFAHKLARQARGAEILVGGRVFRAARADWVFEPLAGDRPARGVAGQRLRQGPARRRHRSRRQARAGLPAARSQGARPAAARAPRRRPAVRPRSRAQGAARRVARRAGHPAQAPDRHRSATPGSASARWSAASSPACRPARPW